MTGDVVKIAGMISALQIRTSKRGNRFAQFRLEDRSGGIKGVVLGDSFNKLSAMLVDDGMFIADGNIEAAEGQEPTLKINELRSLDEAEAVQAREVNITIPQKHRSEAYFEHLYGLLERDRGRTNVFITIDTGDTKVRIHAEALSVAGSRSLQKDLEAVGCSVDWIH
jgi:DNA polymerase-3 subunit alpha